MRKILFLLAACCIAWVLPAQNKYEKWGKVPDEDLKMTVYPADSSAEAVVLQDVGSIDIRSNQGTFVVEHTRFRRIKVFDVSAFDKGNLLIYYRSGNTDERLFELEIELFLPNGEKQKVKSDNIFTEKINKYWSVKKIFIPNLQKGAVIEYRYTRRSDNIVNLYDWYFQEDIPVRWSQLELSIPVYLNYVYLMYTPHPFQTKDTKETEEIGINGDRYKAVVATFGLGDLPAIKNEPYMTTTDDYRARIGFQLKSINFPGEASRNFMTTWTDLAKLLEEKEHFGQQYLKNGNFKTVWKAFSANLKSGEPQDTIVEKALHFVSSNIKWDRDYRFFTNDDLDEAFARKTGSSADLNLCLVALLKKAGVKAFPMLVSTRSNGRTYPAYPFIDQFNSVVAYVPQGDGGILLDATNPFHAVNQLRRDHYNTNGWLVDPEHPVWVNLKAPEYAEIWYGALKLSEEGTLEGSFTLSGSGALGVDWRNALESVTPEKFVKNNFTNAYPELKIDSISFIDRENPAKPLAVQFKCRIPGAANVVNDFIYCKPVLDFFIEENPFKRLKRTFPVNFPYPIKAQYVLVLDLPAGYTLAEMPESVRTSLPDSAAKISFSCQKNSESQLQIILKMNVSKLDFNPDEYEALRKFFEMAAEKTKLQLVLKKT